MNRVLDLEIIRKYPAYHEAISFFKGIVKPDYKFYMRDFYVSYAKIILKNPLLFFKVRFKTFLATAGLDRQFINNSPWDIYKEPYDGEDIEILNLVENDKLSKPWNYTLRTQVMHLLKGVGEENYEFALYGQILWNFIPMLIALVVTVLYSLIKKNYVLLLLGLLCLFKVPLIFVTAPANYFFYYFSIYLIGLFPIGYMFYKMLNRGEKDD
ncbi:MAG: hypothetical protein K2M17_03500 [Bacilli bacterium]|nr:hypothetical protein [Bacilli bacterium]